MLAAAALVETTLSRSGNDEKDGPVLGMAKGIRASVGFKTTLDRVKPLLYVLKRIEAELNPL